MPPARQWPASAAVSATGNYQTYALLLNQVNFWANRQQERPPQTRALRWKCDAQFQTCWSPAIVRETIAELAARFRIQPSHTRTTRQERAASARGSPQTREAAPPSQAQEAVMGCVSRTPLVSTTSLRSKSSKNVQRNSHSAGIRPSQVSFRSAL